MKCSNCEEAESDAVDVSVVVCAGRGAKPFIRLCPTCTQNVLTMKIVLKREDPTKSFVFEQYLPVESVK